jgi:PAS domain S-box-containing protein
LFRLNAASRRWLAWLPVVVALLPVVCLMLSLRLAVMPELQRQAQNDLQRRAEVLAERIRSQLDDAARALRQLARQPLPSESEQRLPAVLAAARAELDWLREQQPALIWVGLVAPDGRVLAASRGGPQEESVAQRPAFQQAWQQGQFLGDFDAAALRQPRQAGQADVESRLFDLAVRLHDAQGRPSGVLLAHGGARWLQALQSDALTGLPAGHGAKAQVLPDGPNGGDLGAGGPPQEAVLAARLDVSPSQSGFDAARPWQVLLTRDLDEALSAANPLMAAIAWPGLLAAGVLGAGSFWLTRRVMAPRQAPIHASGPLAADARYVKQVLDHLPVGVVVSGRGLAIEHVNATLTRQLGWTTEAVQGQIDGEFLCHPADSEPLAAQLRAMQGAPGELQARFTARHAEGSSRAVQWHFVPLLDSEGALQGGISVVLDIDAETTARRRAAALDQRLRLLLEVAVDHALVLLDEDGGILSWNVGAARVFGRSAAQAEGRGFEELFENDSRVVGLPQRVLHEARATGRSVIDGPLQHTTGRRLHGAGSLYAMPAQAWPAGYALIVRDVSAQQAAALRLAESEARLAAVVGGASDAIVSVDADGRVQLFNPAAQQIFGRSADSVLGQPLDELLPGTERQAHGLAIKAFQRSGQAMRRMAAGRVWGQRADGARLALEASISQAQVGGRTVMTAILRDVTARLQAEQALQSYQHELAGLSQRLLAQEKETTRRLAQTLHDDLGQTITAMRLTFDACRSVFPTEGTFAQRLERLNDLIATSSRQVRQALVELRPPLLDDLGLAPALDNEVAVRRAAHPEVQLVLKLPTPVEEQRWPPTVEYAAFMIAREALQNSLQHGSAKSVKLVLHGDARRLQLEVLDDGIGLPDAGTVKPGHLGLVGMRERALAIGAQFVVAPRSERGTAVRLEWENKAMGQSS